MEQATLLEPAIDTKTSVENRPKPRPLTPEQAFEAHVHMCFECHNAHHYETSGGGYCPEAYRLFSRG